jgi:hypothetical protein
LKSLASCAKLSGLVAIVAVGVLILWRLLSSCSYGFDFTDESFYLILIDNPFLFRIGIHQFGFIYHPLWAFVGKDIALLRQANVLITMGLAFVLSLLLLRGDDKNVGNSSESMAKVWWVGLGFGLSTVASVVFFFFFTPSYNSLAFQALLVAAIGLTMADRSFSRNSIIGWVLLAIGGWLAFMAKPTTAAALAVFALSYVVLARIARPALLGLAMGMALLLLVGFAYAVDGSPMVFIARLSESIANTQVFDIGQANWLRMDTLNLTSDEWFYQLLVVAVVWLGIMASATCGWEVGKSRWRSLVGAAGRVGWLVLFVVAVATSVAIGFDLTSWRHAGEYRVLPLAGIGLGAVLGSFSVWRWRMLAMVDRRVWCSVVLLLLVPYAAALGSNNNYWRVMQWAGFFWVCAGIVLLVRLYDGGGRHLACLLAIAVAQVISINCIMLNIEHPYRQTKPLLQNNEVVNLHLHGSPILLSKGFADYIGALRMRAAENGYVPGTPVLDLTGRYPGALFVLGAKPVGTAWLNGAYSCSVRMATHILDHVPANELRSAWVLTEPEGPSPLPVSLLKRYGLSLEKDYGLVAIFFAPEGGDSSGAMQYLYKPGVASRIELRSITEERFPIALPPQTLACERLEGKEGLAHGWVNVGWRGKVSVQGIEEEPGMMRLVAGVAGQERGENNRPCLLLQPAAAGDQGMTVVHGSQIAEFECDLRSTTQTSSGRLRLRLDARAASGWTYADGDRYRLVKLGEEWTRYRVMVRLGNNIKGIRPIIEWLPGLEGDTLELRAPIMRWLKIVTTVPAPPADVFVRSTAIIDNNVTIGRETK